MSFADRFKAATDAEATARDLAMSNWPIPLCGVTVKQFTLFHHLVLSVCKSPFLIGEEPTMEDCAAFLWILSTDYSRDKKARDRFIKKRVEPLFAKGLWRRPVGLPSVVMSIRTFIEIAHMDAPAGSAPGKSYCSPTAGIVDLIAHEYGWDCERIIHTPLAALFQYLKRINLRRNPDAPQFNPSDRLLSEYMRERNEEAQRNRLKDLGQS